MKTKRYETILNRNDLKALTECKGVFLQIPKRWNNKFIRISLNTFALRCINKGRLRK